MIATVEDNGPGVPPEHHGRLFNAFFSTKGTGGSGLGLWISRQIVAEHGGEIALDDSPGGGARFTITFPSAEFVRDSGRHGPGSHPALAPAVRGLATTAPAAAKRLPGVLVIEGDPRLRAAIARRLRKCFSIIGAANAEEAARVLASPLLAIDAVLCEATLPREGAAAVLIAAKCSRPELARRFVFMTGGEPTPDATALAAGSGVEILRKPFAPTLLEKAIRDRLLDGLSDGMLAAGG